MKKICLLLTLGLVLVLTACSENAPSLTTEQQEAWDLIENRIESGYDSWEDLWDWSIDTGIPWGARVDGERPTNEVINMAAEFGLVSNYINANPGFGLDELDNADEIILLINFEYFTYNEDVVKLSELDRFSNDSLTNWLNNGGLERLEQNFAIVDIMTLDESGVRVEFDETADLEFVSWDFANTGLVAFENSRINIGRTFREVLPTQEEAQTMLIEAIEVMSRESHISDFGRSVSPSVSDLGSWLGFDSQILEIANIDRIRATRINEEGTSLPGSANPDATNFVSWTFEYEVANNGRISLNFTLVHDIYVEAPVPTEYRNALRSGRDYLRIMNFSYTSLRRQLEFERFSASAINWAMVQLDEDTDWYAHAVGSADQYLRLMSFSPAGLRDQLIFEGFTRSQADHAVDIVFD